jgi:hypothetical protein
LWPDDFLYNVSRFAKFWADYQGVKLPHVEPVYTPASYPVLRRDRWDACDLCGVGFGYRRRDIAGSDNSYLCSKCWGRVDKFIKAGGSFLEYVVGQSVVDDDKNKLASGKCDLCGRGGAHYDKYSRKYLCGVCYSDAYYY